MANRFVLNETSYHGKGAIAEIATEIKARAFKKAFVCSDPDLIKFGVTKKVTDILDNAEIAYEVFSEIKANPTVENVQAGVAAFKASGADCIVAIGGGSSMDTAKAIGIIITNPEFADVVSLEGVAQIHDTFQVLRIQRFTTQQGNTTDVIKTTVFQNINDGFKGECLSCIIVPEFRIEATLAMVRTTTEEHRHTDTFTIGNVHGFDFRIVHIIHRPTFKKISFIRSSC